MGRIRIAVVQLWFAEGKKHRSYMMLYAAGEGQRHERPEGERRLRTQIVRGDSWRRRIRLTEARRRRRVGGDAGEGQAGRPGGRLGGRPGGRVRRGATAGVDSLRLAAATVGGLTASVAAEATTPALHRLAAVGAGVGIRNPICNSVTVDRDAFCNANRNGVTVDRDAVTFVVGRDRRAEFKHFAAAQFSAVSGGNSCSGVGIAPR